MGSSENINRNRHAKIDVAQESGVKIVYIKQ